MNGGANGNPLTTNALGDTASFIDLPAAVEANVTTGKATSGSDTDTLTNVENLFGSQFNDTLTGNASAGATPNGLEGWLGDDTLKGNGGFVEIAAYLFAPAAVTVTMGSGNSNGSSSGGEGNDTLIGITGIAGSNFNDTLTGGNILFGAGGDDHITGGPSNDTIYGDGRSPDPTDGNDTVDAGAGNDNVFGAGGDDNLDGGGGTDAGTCGAGTDVGKNFEVDITTGQPVGATGRPADCES